MNIETEVEVRRIALDRALELSKYTPPLAYNSNQSFSKPTAVQVLETAEQFYEFLTADLCNKPKVDSDVVIKSEPIAVSQYGVKK